MPLYNARPTDLFALPKRVREQRQQQQRPPADAAVDPLINYEAPAGNPTQKLIQQGVQRMTEQSAPQGDQLIDYTVGERPQGSQRNPFAPPQRQGRRGMGRERMGF